jgi:starch-binding outer membrane protein SusE/F
MKTKLHFLLIALFFGIGMNAAAPVLPTPVWLTGTGVGGWTEGGVLQLATTDGVTYTLNNFQIVGDGEIKFTEGTWPTAATVTVGQPEWPSGVADNTAGGTPNIHGVLGWWSVTFNYGTKAYTFSPGVNPDRVVKINGGGLATDVTLVTSDGENYSKESVVFATGGSGKFIEGVSDIQPTPTANWSSAIFPAGTGTQDGALIPIAAGVYYTFFNILTGDYAFDPTVVSIVGSFQGWSDTAAVDMLTEDNINYHLDNYVFATSAELKFMDNHSWNINMGSNTNPSGFPTGTATQANAQNIAIPAGTYNILFNRATLAYEFVSLNAAVNYVGTTSTPATKGLSTADGENYVGQEITFSAAGSGSFEEVTSVLNPGPTFFTWPAATSPAAGFWNVALNKTTGVNSFTPTVVGVIGDFAPSNWGSDVDFTSTDGINYTLNGVVITKPRANFKIRDNHGWTVQFGHAVALVDPATSPMTGTLVDTDTKDMWLAAGTYNITFNRVTFEYAITNALAVNKFDANKFSVYPNPTTNSWNFTSANSEISSVRIVDMLGKTVMSKKASSNEVSVDASSLSKGMYFAEIVAGNAVQTVKVIRD